MRHSIHLVPLLFFALFVSHADAAGQITILTSYPKEIPDTYKEAFERKYPDVKVEVIRKNTKKSISHIREAAPGQRPDIFWASSPDAFELLADASLLEKLGRDVGNSRIPNRIGIYPVNDPQNRYKGQALSGYGIMWNKDYTHRYRLPNAYQWEDLTKPEYFGHVVMSAPSRSGTTHLTVESILQGEGWGKGWGQLLMIGGNCGVITQRSHDVPIAVSEGKYGFGVVIDFMGLAKKYSGHRVDFTYPRMTAVVPANIALVSGGGNPTDAKKFINFTLSQEGQILLFDPKVSRLPALPEAYLAGSMPSGYPNVFQVAFHAKVRFKAEVSEQRYALVAALFDQAVTFNLKDLQAATKAVQMAELKLTNKYNPKAAELLEQARRLAFVPVVDAGMAGNSDFLEQFRKAKAAAGGKPTPQEEEWGAKAKANYQKAEAFATEAAALIE